MSLKAQHAVQKYFKICEVSKNFLSTCKKGLKCDLLSYRGLLVKTTNEIHISIVLQNNRHQKLTPLRSQASLHPDSNTAAFATTVESLLPCAASRAGIVVLSIFDSVHYCCLVPELLPCKVYYLTCVTFVMLIIEPCILVSLYS